jgi:hypothetical protein
VSLLNVDPKPFLKKIKIMLMVVYDVVFRRERFLLETCHFPLRRTTSGITSNVVDRLKKCQFRKNSLIQVKRKEIRRVKMIKAKNGIHGFLLTK